MKKFSFRQFLASSKAGQEDDQSQKALKRREQVRKAQRTHRERKDAYVKSLEKEVLQLRTNEAQLLQKSKTLHAEIIRLQGILTEHKIPHVSDIFENQTPPTDDDFNYPVSSAMVFLDEHRSSNPHIHVGKEQALPINQEQHHQNNPGVFSDTSPPPPPPKDTSHSIGDLDLTDVGMDFVLTLEDPCLLHTQGNPEDPEAPTGHALTATASILFQAPGTHSPGLPSINTWETPRAVLDRLLKLSEDIPLAEEVTPIKAWNHICHLPALRATDAKVLSKLTKELSKHVKCYGFGAVIDQIIFENTLNAFGLGRIP